LTVSQKVALSLLISVVLVGGFSVLAFTGFFNLVETRFYNPSITKSLDREVRRDAETIQAFLDELQEGFAAAMEDGPVKRSFLPNQTTQDIFERTRLYGILMESQKGLQSVRFVDVGGMRLHFSTDPEDIQSQANDTITYKNYEETASYVPYGELSVASGGNPKITLDQRNDRIVFSFPFYDSMEIYRGTALYSLSIRAVAERLIVEGRIKIGEDLSVISVPPGVVSGLPSTGRDAIIPVISSVWRENLFSLTALDSQSSSSALALVSAKTEKGLIVGRVVDAALFAFPQVMKMILLASIFLTVFLTIFLAFNLRPDTLTVIQNRLKGLQLSLIREYYERKGEMDWNHWYHELELRREDVRSELKRGVKGKPPALLEDIDSLIDKSWDEILTAIGGKRETRLAIDEDKLQNILHRMLLARGDSPVLPGGGPAAADQVLNVPATRGAAPGATSVRAAGPAGADAAAAPEVPQARSEEPEEIETLEEMEEPEDMEELSGEEEPETAATEEVPEAEDAEPAVAAELPGEEEPEAPAEPAAVEEVPEAEEAEPADLEELPEAEDAEPAVAAELPGEEEPEVPAEPAAAEEVPETEEAEPADLEELSGAEEQQYLSGGEEADEVEDLSEVEDIDEEPDNIKILSDTEDLTDSKPPVPFKPPASPKSNIQLVFGEDDIPTIVESSGLELVDDMDIPGPAGGGEPDFVEELEELEELETAPAPVSFPLSEADMASRIEFGSSGKEEEGEELEEEIEIVSPFADMYSKFDDKETFRDDEEDTGTIKTSGRLEELNADYSMSMVYKPFQYQDKGEPQELKSAGPGIITQKNGIHYVDKKVKTPDDETFKTLDPGLKNLVDSVIGKK
jgi:hypothetical protein